MTLFCPHSPCCNATVNFECQLAAGTVMTRTAVCIMCLEVGNGNIVFDDAVGINR